jgi:hypothetical protein
MLDARASLLYARAATGQAAARAERRDEGAAIHSINLVGAGEQSPRRGLVSAAPECFLPGPAEPHGGDDQTDH